MKIIIVSSDVFNKYIKRKGKVDTYCNQARYGVWLDMQLRPILEYIVGSKFELSRVFVDVPYLLSTSLEIFTSVCRNLDNFENYSVIIEDFRLPKYTAMCYKKYSQMNKEE